MNAATTSPRRSSPRLAAAAAATAAAAALGSATALICRTTSPYFSPSTRRVRVRGVVTPTPSPSTLLSSSSSSNVVYRDNNRDSSEAEDTTIKSAVGKPAKKGRSSSEVNNVVKEAKAPTKKVKKAKSPSKSPARTKGSSTVPRTNSFEPLWHGSEFVSSLLEREWSQQQPSVPPLSAKNDRPPIHTLILGTHPSITSLSRTQYFGHDQNAFWWIVGDCLQFRRNAGISTATNTPYSLCQFLRYDESNIIPYEEQVGRLCSHGYALWDVVHSCVRPGSLDASITEEVSNDVHSFCKEHPSIKRIVFANCGTGCSMFYKHFKSWWSKEDDDDGILVPGENVESKKAFSRFVYRRDKYLVKETFEHDQVRKRPHRLIECIAALAVSPAAAMYTYEVKRDHWEKYCFEPGLKDYKDWERKETKQGNVI